MLETKHRCTFDLFASIPTLDDGQTRMISGSQSGEKTTTRI